MAAHAGLFSFGGPRLEPAQVEALRFQLAEFAAGTANARVRDGVAVVSRTPSRDRATPGDRIHESPHGHIIVWDGRLDNRRDLDFQLPARLAPGERTDAHLALDVYERWGVQGLERLIGDWSLAIYDSLVRRVVLASDFAGNRGLYFTADTRQLLWSSSLAMLLKVTGRSAVSPEFIAGYLTASVPPGATPYKRIAVVKPGHAVVIAADGRSHESRFWDISVGRIEHADPRDYAAELQQLVTESIDARMRGRAVWAELSGGLDSSTIVCVADRIARKRGLSSPLNTISCCATDSPDERVFIEAVASQCRIRTHYLRIEDCDGVGDSERCWITPRHPSNALLCEYRLIEGKGGDAVLSGHAGDILFGNTTHNPAAILAPLIHGRLWDAAAAARAWARAARRTIWEVIGDASTLIGSDARVLRYSLRRALDDQGPLISRDLRAAAAERFFLSPSAVAHWHQEMERRCKRVRAFGARDKHLMLASLSSLLDDRSFQSPSEFPMVSVTYPYLHRPLVTFVLSVPSGVLCAPGAPRALMRDAFRPVLPEIVAQRFSKGRLTERGRTRLIRNFATRYDARTMKLVQGGFIDAGALNAELARIRLSGVRRLRNLPELLRLERWLVALDEGQVPLAHSTAQVPA